MKTVEYELMIPYINISFVSEYSSCGSPMANFYLMLLDGGFFDQIMSQENIDKLKAELKPYERYKWFL